MIISGCVGLTLLSPQFGGGEGGSDRAAVAAVVLQSIMAAGFLLAAVGVVFRHGRVPLWGLMAVALLARLALAPSHLIQASDCYRYALDGVSVLHGVNPFRHLPELIRLDAREDFRAVANEPRARALIERVNHPNLPTIYPPLAQVAFALGAVLTPWDWHGQRWVFMGLDIATILLLVWGLRRLGKPMEWAILYAWNPIILKDITNSVHLDSLAGLWVAALCLVLALGASAPTRRTALLAAVFFAAAVLSKVYPVILGPVCLAVLCRSRGGMSRGVFFCLGAVLLMALTVAPFLSVGPARLLQSFRAFTFNWERNSGAYAMLAWVMSQPRVVSMLIPFAVAFFVSWRVYTATPKQAAEAIIDAFQAVLLAWFLFLPIAYPWYATALLATCALRPRPWACVLSISFCLYYLPYLNLMRYPFVCGVAVRSVEHGAVWLTLALGWFPPFRRKIPPQKIPFLKDSS